MGAEALAYWVDASEISVATQLAFHLFDSNGNRISIDGTANTSFFAPGQTAYLIPSDTGVAQEIQLGGDAPQPVVTLDIGFVGYVVVPITDQNPDPAGISKISLNRNTNGKRPGDNPPPDEWMIQPDDAGKKMYFDNFGAVKDLDFFLENIYQFGAMTGASEPKPSYSNGVVSWQAIDSASSYRVAVYDDSYKFVKSATSAGTTCEIGELSSGYVQVQALDASGAVVASTKALRVLDTSLYTMLNDGSDASLIRNVQYVEAVAVASGVGVSPDDSYYSWKFWGTPGRNDWGTVGFDITGEAEFKPQAVSVFINMSGLTGKIGFNASFFAPGAANLAAAASATGQIKPTNADYYLISTADGSVTSGTFNNGYQVPAGFVGYLVFPVQLADNFNYSDVQFMTLMNNWNTNAAAIPAEDAGKSFYLDNVAVVADLGLYVDTAASQFGTMRPSSAFDAPVLNGTTVSWGSVAEAASYELNVYGEDFAYLTTYTSETTSAQVSGLPEVVNLQVIARDADGAILQNSMIAHVSSVKTYDVLNEANDPATLKGLFLGEEVGQVGNAKTPTGKGLSMMTYNQNNSGSSVVYTVPETDLAQYEALAFYVDLDMTNPDATGWTFQSITDEKGQILGNLLDPKENPYEVLPPKNDPAAFNIYYISARDGSVSRLPAGWEANNASFPKDTAGWIVMLLNKDVIGESYTVSSLTVNFHGWHRANEEKNLNQPMYIGQLLGIKSYDEFVASLDLRSMGYLGATDGTGTLSAELEVGSGVTYTWDAVANAAQYRVNLYDLTSGKAVYTDRVMTNETNYTIAAEDLGKVGIQVLALDATGATINISNPGAFEAVTSDMLPTLAGATFNESKVVRFQNATPAALASGVTVVTHGTVLIPTQLLEGELTLATANVANASSDTAVENGTTYYSYVSNSEDKTGVRISARAYAILKDGYGNSYTVYSAQTPSRSVNKMARDMAAAVLTYEDAKALVTTWTDKVTSETTAKQVEKTGPADITGPELAEFVLANPDAVAKAAELKDAQ